MTDQLSPPTSDEVLPGLADPSTPDPAPASAAKATGTPPARKRTKPGKAGKVRDAAPKAARGPGRPSTRAVRERKLGENLSALGMLVAVAVNPADGLAVVNHAPSIASSLAQLAEENARVARLLDGAMESSAWFGVVAALGGLGVAIAANHGLLPPALAAVAGSPTAGTAGDDTGPSLADLEAMFGGSTPPPATADGG